MKTCWTGLLILALSACSVKQEEVSIFAIPTTATPSELEENGFRIYRSGISFSDKKEHDRMYGEFNLGYADVHASYPDEDTTRLNNYRIWIDCKPFEKMTGFKAKNYASLEIDGYPYEVKLTPNNLSLELKRLGL